MRALMRFYAGYRQVLASALCLLFFFAPGEAVLGATQQSLFTVVTLLYLAAALAAVIRHSLFAQHYSQTQLFAEFITDIVALALLSYASGGDKSGLQSLIFVTISACSITLPGRLSLALAALASIAALTEVAAHNLSGQASTQEFVVAGLQGVAFFSTAVAIRYLSSRIVAAQGLAETRRRDLEQLYRINQWIVQRMQTGILLMTPRGEIRLINAAAAELLGKVDTRLAEGELAPAALVALARSHTQGNTLLTVGEGKVEVFANMTTLTDQPDSERLVYLENISKINQRAQNMKLASLGRFTASIAHEIRNPLSAISHAAQLLKESPGLDEADLRFANIIESNAHRMDNIIQNILEMSRGRAPQAERIDLEEFLRRFIQEWRPTDNIAMKSQLTVSALHSEVNVDPGQLRQIIANITENGARYGAAATGTAQLVFRLANHPASEAVILDIIDNGPGVPAEEEDKIFEPFYTTDSRGNGLGLYLCRELCLANQISVHYRRDNAAESCFRLQFSHPARGALPQT